MRCIQARIPVAPFERRLHDTSYRLQRSAHHLLQRLLDELAFPPYRPNLWALRRQAFHLHNDDSTSTAVELIELIGEAIAQVRVALAARADIEQDALFA